MKKLVAIALILVLVFAMAACGGGKDAAVGTWKLTGLFEGGEDYSAYLSMLGMDMTMTLEAGGTGTMEMMGQKIDVTWGDGKISYEGDSIPFTVDGDKLTMEEDGSQLVFTRQ